MGFGKPVACCQDGQTGNPFTIRERVAGLPGGENISLDVDARIPRDRDARAASRDLSAT